MALHKTLTGKFGDDILPTVKDFLWSQWYLKKGAA